MKKVRNLVRVFILMLLFTPFFLYAQEETTPNIQPDTTSQENIRQETNQDENMIEQETEVNQESMQATQAQFNMQHLDPQPDSETINQFGLIADENARQFQQKLNLEEESTEDIKEHMIEYFSDMWESRIKLDQEAADNEKAKENEKDLAYGRVDLVSEIEDELSDEQINQWKSYKVDWWTSVDKAIFDVQEQAIESGGLSRGIETENNEAVEDEEEDDDNQE